MQPSEHWLALNHELDASFPRTLFTVAPSHSRAGNSEPRGSSPSQHTAEAR